MSPARWPEEFKLGFLSYRLGLGLPPLCICGDQADFLSHIYAQTGQSLLNQQALLPEGILGSRLCELHIRLTASSMLQVRQHGWPDEGFLGCHW